MPDKTPHDYKMIYDFIVESENKLIDSQNTDWVKNIQKITFHFLKERALMKMEISGIKVAQKMGA